MASLIWLRLARTSNNWGSFVSEEEGGVFIDFIFSRVSQAIVIHARDKTFGLFSDIKADSWLLPMGLQPTVGVCEE